MNYLIFSTSLVRSLLKLHTIVLIFSLLSFSFLAAQSDGLNVVSPGVIAYCYQPVSGSVNKKIYTINEDGTNNALVGNLPVSVNGPKWSPDGNKIVMYGYPNSSTWSIYLMNSDGSNFIRLTNTIDVWDNLPAWSPNGDKIVFTRTFPNQNGREEVWVMDANGDNEYWTGIEGGGARWSPDNLKFVYHSNHSGNYDIFISNIDGTNEIRLTFSTALDLQPDWSPDGQQIAFTTDRNGNFDVYTINSNGAGLFNLTNNEADDFTPDYSPDGTKIAFESDLDNMAADHGEIYVIDIAGTNLKRVTTTPATATAITPDWFPVDSTTNVSIGQNISITGFALLQNYPNPFNPTTIISYQIPQPGFVSLKIFDVLGNEIATLANEEKQAGNYEIIFDGTDLVTGIYLYRIRTGNFVEAKKMLLIK